MIDFGEMVRCQTEGEQQIASLEEVETQVLQHYASLTAEAVMKMGAQRQKPIDQVVVNAVKNGLALGLRLSIINREVQRR